VKKSRVKAPCALTIAGSDSGGGAGIQADLKTFSAYGVHGLSAVAALTAQNTQGVTAVHVPAPEFLRVQIDTVFADFHVGAVKLGMLAEASIIEVVAEALAQFKPPHVVLDPVMLASSGARLLEEDAIDVLRERLFPLATLITPNLPEAELLLGCSISDEAAAEAALGKLLALGPGAVLLKGGHMPGGGPLVDRFAQGAARIQFSHERLPVRGHGTGCTLASAIAASLSCGATLFDACADATDYVHGALRTAHFPGDAELAVLDHMWRLRKPFKPV
jgi:hydroxymethylpyrimidine/phosphomethylpyrimidine kinase